MIHLGLFHGVVIGIHGVGFQRSSQPHIRRLAGVYYTPSLYSLPLRFLFHPLDHLLC